MRSRTYAELQRHTPASEGPAPAAAQTKRVRRQLRNLGIPDKVVTITADTTELGAATNRASQAFGRAAAGVSYARSSFVCILVEPEPDHRMVLKGQRGDTWGYCCPSGEYYWFWTGSRPHLRRLAASHG